MGYMYNQSTYDMNMVRTKCDRILRSNRKVLLKYTFSNLTKLHNSPFYRGVKIWNTLPEKIQKCRQKKEFKRMVKNVTI